MTHCQLVMKQTEDVIVCRPQLPTADRLTDKQALCCCGNGTLERPDKIYYVPGRAASAGCAAMVRFGRNF